MVVSGRTIGDQDLLSSRANVIFKHRVLVCSFEQVVHHCWRIFGKRFEERCTQNDASLEDLQNDVHVVGLHLEHSFFEPFHEVFKGFDLLHLDILQGAYVLFVAS